MYKTSQLGTARPSTAAGLKGGEVTFVPVQRAIDPNPKESSRVMRFTLSKQSAPPPPGKSIFEFRPPVPNFGALTEGFVFQMSVVMRNISTNRERYRIIQPASLNTKDKLQLASSVKCLTQPGHLAPGCAVNLELELAASVVGESRTVIEIQSQHQTHYLEVISQVLSTEAISALHTELRMNNKPLLVPGVRAVGPINFTKQQTLSTSFDKFSRALFGQSTTGSPLLSCSLQAEDVCPETVQEMSSKRRYDWLQTTSRRLEAFFGADDMEELDIIPIHSAMYWDPSQHKLCLDKQLMSTVMDGSQTLEEATKTWSVMQTKRQSELEKGGFITSSMIQNIREYGVLQSSMIDEEENDFIVDTASEPTIVRSPREKFAFVVKKN